MTRIASLRPPLGWAYSTALISLALGFGLVLAWLPGWLGLGLVVGLALLLISAQQPVVALGLTLLFGPAKALIAVVSPGLPIDPGQIGVVVFAGLWLTQRLLQRQVRLPLIALSAPLLLFMVVGMFSLWGARDVVEGLQELVKWAQIWVVAMLTYDLAQRGQLKWVLAVVLLAGVLQAASGIWQWGLRGTGPETFAIGPGQYRAYGTFEQPNPFGGFMGLVWPLAAGLALGWLAEWIQKLSHAMPKDWLKVSRIPALMLGLCGAAAMISGVALLVSYSRGAWLGAAAAAGVLLVFWPRQRWLGLAFGGLGALGGLALWQAGLLPASITNRLASIGDFVQVYDVRGVHINDINFSLIERIAHWQAAFAMADAHPWLGVGIGNYSAAYPDFRLINWVAPLGHAHNIYFNLLAEVGLLGLMAYGLLWGAIVMLTLRALKQHNGWQRGVALGLLGVWAHLSAHHLVDNLLVNNLHLYFGALLGVVSVLAQKRPATALKNKENHASTD